jgi:hypothetical protein
MLDAPDGCAVRSHAHPAAPFGEGSSFQFDFKNRLLVGRYTMFAVVTLNGDVAMS